jgi:hypothetical protein
MSYVPPNVEEEMKRFFYHHLNLCFLFYVFVTMIYCF